MGFSLVEIVVVVVILIVLGSIAALAAGGAKSSARASEARAAGSAYLQGITQWQGSNANRNPAASDFLDDEVNALEDARGPRGLDGRPVMAMVPSGVSSGRVLFSLDAANCGTAIATPQGVGMHSGVVSYCPGQAPNVAIRVLTRKPNAAWTEAAGAKLCWLGAMPAGQPRC